jgi:DNA-directed RNA polymerase specialized sigma24 family protein
VSGRRVEIRDIRDAEAFARRALDDALRGFGARKGSGVWLRESDYEDAHAELLCVLCELDRRYDPGKGVAFSTYAYRILRLRVVDWYRGRFEQSRGGRRAELLSLDRPSGERGGGGLDQDLAARESDPAESRSPDLQRVLGERCGSSERLEPLPRGSTAGRARDGDRGADRRDPDETSPGRREPRRRA